MAGTERFQLRHTEAGRLNLPLALGFSISWYLEDTSALGLLDCRMGLELLLEHGGEVALVFTSAAYIMLLNGLLSRRTLPRTAPCKENAAVN